MNNHIQKHIQTVKDAFDQCKYGYLSLNSTELLQQSIEMLEQQQREIADKDREIERMRSLFERIKAFKGNGDSIYVCYSEALSIANEVLSPKEEETTDVQK